MLGHGEIFVLATCELCQLVVLVQPAKSIDVKVAMLSWGMVVSFVNQVVLVQPAKFIDVKFTMLRLWVMGWNGVSHL